MISYRVLLVTAGIMMLSACGSVKPLFAEKEPEKKEQEEVSVAIVELKTTSSINPDIRGQASPLTVRVYELTSSNQFNQSGFFEVYESEEATLGNEFVSRQEFTVTPDQVLRKTVVLSPTTKYLGVVAAYRNIDNAQWRAVSPVLPGEVLYNVVLDGLLVEFK